MNETKARQVIYTLDFNLHNYFANYMRVVQTSCFYFISNAFLVNRSGNIAALMKTIYLGYRIQDTGYRIQDTGYRIQDTGYRIQDTGHREQDTGYRIHDT